ACGGYAGYLLRMRRFDESIAESKRMVELDPVSVLSNRNLAITFYYARQYDQAIEQCKKTLELDPNMVTVYGWLAMAYEHKGLYDEAIKADLQGYDSSGVGPDTTTALREAYAASGWRGYRQKELDLAQKQAKQSYVSPYWIATMYAQLGEKDHALAWLEKAYEQHDWLLTHLNPDPKFDDLRSDPRFKDLLRRMNLEP
ncbi:MAG: TPR end-of-group domain-containing protein, partial [Pyrinomonadaceae bacterium]